MIRATYQSRAYEPGRVVARYVRCEAAGDVLHWCEVDATRRDVRQGSCGPEDVPPDVLARARERRGYFPAYVPWPLATD